MFYHSKNQPYEKKLCLATVLQSCTRQIICISSIIVVVVGVISQCWGDVFSNKKICMQRKNNK